MKIMRLLPVLLVAASLIASAHPKAGHALDSYTVAGSTTQTINEWSACRRVTNNHPSGIPLFVPTKTAAEWQSFYNNPPPNVSVTADCPCGLPWGGQIAHGNSVTAYQSAGGGGACSGSCVSENRSCTNAVLSGSYTFQTCSGGSCGGACVGGYCWYYGAVNNSCNSVCGTHGGYDIATHTYGAVSQATCASVLTALGQTYLSMNGPAFYAGGSSCSKSTNGSAYVNTLAYPDSGSAFMMRACACNN